MIVAKLMGGLGNQMFQYAFGKQLAIKNKTRLFLDLSFLQDRSYKENFTYRDYELNSFNVEENFATEKEVAKFNKVTGVTTLMSLLLTLRIPVPVYLREPHFHFFPKALNAPANTYLDGYWQSEKYFRGIRQILQNEFTPKNSLSPGSALLLERIKKEKLISIHVRRTDYVSNQHISQYHGACTAEYYQQAIDIISDKIANPSFIVFSDEPDWFRRNMRIAFPVVYADENRGSRNFEDLFLMSNCAHNIIANSSFSWWAAWLNNNEDKNVIAPKKWFNNESKDTADLIPVSWQRI
jgi:hypothetical protein